MVASAVGAVQGVLTLNVLVRFLTALCTNCPTVTSGLAITVVLTFVALQRVWYTGFYVLRYAAFSTFNGFGRLKVRTKVLVGCRALFRFVIKRLALVTS